MSDELSRYPVLEDAFGQFFERVQARLALGLSVELPDHRHSVSDVVAKADRLYAACRIRFRRAFADSELPSGRVFNEAFIDTPTAFFRDSNAIPAERSFFDTPDDDKEALRVPQANLEKWLDEHYSLKRFVRDSTISLCEAAEEMTACQGWPTDETLSRRKLYQAVVRGEFDGGVWLYVEPTGGTANAYEQSELDAVQITGETYQTGDLALAHKEYTAMCNSAYTDEPSESFESCHVGTIWLERTLFQPFKAEWQPQAMDSDAHRSEATSKKANSGPRLTGPALYKDICKTFLVDAGETEPTNTRARIWGAVIDLVDENLPLNSHGRIVAPQGQKVCNIIAAHVGENLVFLDSNFRAAMRKVDREYERRVTNG